MDEPGSRPPALYRFSVASGAGFLVSTTLLVLAGRAIVLAVEGILG